MRRIIFFVAAAGLFASPAFAQSTFPTAQGGRVAGVVPMQCDANGANCAPAGDAAAPAAGAQSVQGNVANGGTAAGRPVTVAGADNTNAVRTHLTGTGGATVLGANGSANTVDILALTTDGVTNNAFGLRTATFNYVWNGASYDRMRGDTTGTYVIEVPSAVAAAGVTTVASAAVSGGQVIKASAGNLYGFNVVSGASAGYVMVLNSTTVPADGAVTPARCIPLAANTGIDINLRGQPARFSTGITIVFSTTGCYTKTASATAFIAGDAQ